VDAITAAITFAVGLGGVTLGGLLARRNEQRAHSDRLLVEAINDAVSAAAEVAQVGGSVPQSRYGSAMARIALHAPPTVVERFREFQEDGTTITSDGQARFLAAVQQARKELGRDPVKDGDVAPLLFGAGHPLGG
jgi:hypothetical protein